VKSKFAKVISLLLSILILRLILSRARSKIATGKTVLKLQSGIKARVTLDRRDVTQGQLNVSMGQKELVQHLNKFFFFIKLRNLFANLFDFFSFINAVFCYFLSRMYRIFRFAILIMDSLTPI